MFFSIISFQQIIKTNDDDTFTNLCQTKIPFLWSFCGNGEAFCLWGEDCFEIYLLVDDYQGDLYEQTQ